MVRLLLNLAILILCLARSQSFHSDFRVAKKSRLTYHVVGRTSRMPDRGYKRDCFRCNDDDVTSLPSSPSNIDHFDRCGLAKEWNGLSLSCQMSAHLTEAEKARIYQLFKTNMGEWYKKNWGLEDSEKKKELYHTESHFICVHKITGLTHSKDLKSYGSSASVQEDKGENELVAFAMFRFEWDDEDEPEFPVLFCYEIQICDAHQGKKIGRHVSLKLYNFFLTS